MSKFIQNTKIKAFFFRNGVKWKRLRSAITPLLKPGIVASYQKEQVRKYYKLFKKIILTINNITLQNNSYRNQRQRYCCINTINTNIGCLIKMERC